MGRRCSSAHRVWGVEALTPEGPDPNQTRLPEGFRVYSYIFILGTKNNSYSSIWELKPCHLGTWTVKHSSKVGSMGSKHGSLRVCAGYLLGRDPEMNGQDGRLILVALELATLLRTSSPRMLKGTNLTAIQRHLCIRSVLSLD